jgi:hypothetical protein
MTAHMALRSGTFVKGPGRLTSNVGENMNNQQVRLLISALVLLSGAIASNSSQLNINVGIFLILVGAAMLFVEYFRSFSTKD